MSRFKELIIRQNAIQLAKEIYLLTWNNHKLSKDFWLKDQIQRCAVSIASNIAEWSVKWGKVEFAKYCRIARLSLAELETQLIIAKEIWYVEDQELYNNFISSIEKLHKQINSFISTLIKSPTY